MPNREGASLTMFEAVSATCSGLLQKSGTTCSWLSAPVLSRSA